MKTLKVIAHLLAWIPLGWLVYSALTHNLGGDPQTKLMHELGSWGLIFLLLSLSITPLRKLTRQPQLIKFRRMLGLFSAWYLFLHTLAYVALYLSFDFGDLASEVVERPYITIGFLALLMLIPLTFTSTKKSQRRLGKNWKKLHQLSYIIAGLGLVHLVWQTKSDLNEPLIYVAWGALLLAARIWYKKKSVLVRAKVNVNEPLKR